MDHTTRDRAKAFGFGLAIGIAATSAFAGWWGVCTVALVMGAFYGWLTSYIQQHEDAI